MGNTGYRIVPKTDKTICSEETEEAEWKGSKQRWNSFSMQGWRREDEDFSFAKYDKRNNICCFGVLDGHGGKEVAEFLKKTFWAELIDSREYKDGKYAEALESIFPKMDELLLEKQ